MGNSVDDFDKMIMHVFPSKHNTAKKEWEHESNAPVIKKKVFDAIKDDNQECGITAITIAGKSASASFVGACAASFVLAELVKGLNNGHRSDLMTSQLRFNDDIKRIDNSGRYTLELGATGYQPI